MSSSNPSAIESRERASVLVVTGVPDRELHGRAVRLGAMGVMLKADRLTGSLRPSNVSVLELIISPDIGQARAVASRTQLPIG